MLSPAERQEPVQDRRVDRQISRGEVVLRKGREEAIHPALCGNLSRPEDPLLDLFDGLTCLLGEVVHLWSQAESRTPPEMNQPQATLTNDFVHDLWVDWKQPSSARRMALFNSALALFFALFDRLRPSDLANSLTSHAANRQLDALTALKKPSVLALGLPQRRAASSDGTQSSASIYRSTASRSHPGV